MRRNVGPKSATMTSVASSSILSEEESKREHRQNSFRLLYDNRMALYQFLAIILAAVLACTVRAYSNGPITPRQASALELPGELYFRANKCLSLPLMCAGIMSAMSRLQLWQIGYIGIRITGYIILTTVLSAAVAALAMFAVTPGLYVDLRDNKTNPPVDYVLQDYLIDEILSLFPDNIAQAFILTTITDLKPTFNEDGKQKDVEDWEISWKQLEVTNALGLLCFFTYLGICLGSLDQSFYLIQELFDSLTEIVALCMKKIRWFSPIAFFSTTLATLLSIHTFDPLFANWILTLTFLGVCFVHLLIILPLIYFVATRKQCYTIYLHTAEAALTALVSSSSFASFPTSFHCVDSKLHIPRMISLYYLPLGTTFNMDGVSIFASILTLYTAQGLAKPYLEPAKYVLLVCASTLESAMVPGLSGGMLSPVINMPFGVFDIPYRYVRILKDVDWLHDRLAATVNIMIDSIGVSLIYHLSSHILEEEQENVGHLT